jgi:hypothetical protein
MIETACIQWIKHLCPPDGTILELGSGEGTAALAEYCEVYSVEHDPEYLHLYDSNYIYAPLVDIKPTKYAPDCYYWYDPIVVENLLGNIEYDLLLIDGPPNNVGRGGFFKYMNMFNLDVPIIIDDVNRHSDWMVAVTLARKLRRSMIIPAPESRKLFAVMKRRSDG